MIREAALPMTTDHDEEHVLYTIGKYSFYMVSIVCFYFAKDLTSFLHIN